MQAFDRGTAMVIRQLLGFLVAGHPSEMSGRQGQDRVHNELIRQSDSQETRTVSKWLLTRLTRLTEQAGLLWHLLSPHGTVTIAPPVKINRQADDMMNQA